MKLCKHEKLRKLADVAARDERLRKCAEAASKHVQFIPENLHYAKERRFNSFENKLRRNVEIVN